MTFCWVPAGTCRLGSPGAEQDDITKTFVNGARPAWLDDETEAKRGNFGTTGFWMGKYEVTQAEWAAVMRGTPQAAPSSFRPAAALTDTSRFPVENVSWEECRKFLEKLAAPGGYEGVFGTKGAFALPHEDEWEYACRGGLGNGQPFHFGKEINGTQANINGTIPFGTADPFGTTDKGPFRKRPAAVGSYAAKYPHPWGLCDMHGNVWEWCENLHDDNKSRVLRGGSWDGNGYNSRSASRFKAAPTFQNNNLGLRVLFSPG